MNEETAKQAAALEKECFSTPWSEKSLLCELSKPQSRFYVALSGERVIGYAGLQFVLDEGYITNVAVSEKYRKQGVAQLILNKFDECAAASGLAFISLEVRTSNVPAINLYKKCGYETAGLRKGFYREPVEDAYIMTKYYNK